MGEATRSGSKISTPSKPAVAAAASLSSRAPDRQTVATAVRGSAGTVVLPGVVLGRFTDELVQVAAHPGGVGLEPGEQVQRVGGLVHRHQAAVERRAADPGRGL